MPRYRLEVAPNCFKCRGSTVHYRSSENVFLNTAFITEWFECTQCGKIQAKIVKIIGKINGWKTTNLV